MSIQIERICVPTDFSECAEHAVKYGTALAHQYGAKLHLVHVLHDIHEKLQHPDFTREGTTVKQFLASLENGATEYLAKLALGREAAKLEIVRVYLTGNTGDEIARYVTQNSIDLVVVGAQGRNGAKQPRLGSTAERIIRLSPCPVLTVTFPEERGFLRDDEQLPGVE